MNIDSNAVRKFLVVVILVVIGFVLFGLQTRSDQISEEQNKMSDTIQTLERETLELQTIVDKLQKELQQLNEAYGNHNNDSERHNF